MNKYNTNCNCKFNISYHIVWIPKYRKHILIDNIEYRFKQIMADKISSLGLTLGSLECIPDHIHLFIKANTNITVSYIVKMLKGYTSRMLRLEFKQLNKYKHLWASGYFCETIGNISEASVIKYINNQKSA